MNDAIEFVLVGLIAGCSCITFIGWTIRQLRNTPQAPPDREEGAG